MVDETAAATTCGRPCGAPQFAGTSRIDQHRLVRAAVQPRMDDGSIHALSIKTGVLDPRLRPAAATR